MKTIASITSVFIALAVAALPVKATTYTGPGVADGGGPADGGAINSVVVNNDASTITFTIDSTQPMASYIFYSIEMQYLGGPVGDTSLVNPWGPHLGIGSGENALINTYGTGASALTYNGGTWTQNSSGSYVAGGTGSTFATMTFSLASLGLSSGQSIYFDVVSSYVSPSGQAAYGALDNTGYLPESDNSYQPWLGSNFYDSATSSGSTFSSTIYTIAPVPEPGTYVLFGLGSLLWFVRRLRSNA